MLSCLHNYLNKITKVIIFLSVSLFFSASSANGDSFDQSKVQAAYIYNFIKFTTWPEPYINYSSRLNICLFGEDNITEKLNELDGNFVRQKKIVINTENTEKSLENCHVLYISPGMFRRYKYLMDIVSGKPVLTVGNDSKLLRAGGIISLKEIKGKQKFEVNIQALTESSLDISSKLLALAIIENDNHE